MADRNAIIESIIKNKIILIFRGIPKEKLNKTIDAAYKGGIRVFEFAFDASGKVPDSEITEYIADTKERFGGFVSVGAGTVLKKSQVISAANAGADFIISPVVDEEIIKTTLEYEMVSIPGALTPTEAVAAHNFGADFVKLFPAGQGGGCEYLKALATPLSHIRFLAVAGIEIEDIKPYLSAGAKGFGISSGILNKKFIDESNYDAIEETARKYVSAL